MATVSDFLIDRLIEWGLHRFYGFPGDGIGGFDGALGRAERAGREFHYIRPTHDETRHWDGPVVLDAATDKNVPLLPAHISFEQAKGVAESVLRGDPDAAQIVGHGARAMASQRFGRFRGAGGE